MSITGLGLELVGSDGNAFAILGKAMKVMKRAGFSKEKIKEFRKEATSGDYDNLLRVCSNWFDVS